MDTAPPAANPLIGFVERLRQRSREVVYDWQPTNEPPPPPFERTLKPCPPPEWTRTLGSVEEARRLICDSITTYLENPMPDHLLLIKALPGTGKTTAAVEAIDRIDGHRIAYAGPRHDLFRDVVAKSSHPERWYEWLPRQAEDPDTGKIQTCNYAGQMADWLNKGYRAMDFCGGVCGWDYIKDGCIYHRQKLQPEPVIYTQHLHVTLGHPMKFNVLFGDESPLTAFTHEWRIPAKWIMPPGMDPAEPLTEVLSWMTSVAQNCDKSMQGPELIEFLGGADAVVQACESYELPVGDVAKAGTIHRAEEVEDAPYFHLFDLAPLLAREARAAKRDLPYPHRVIVSQGQLTLLLRRRPDPKQIPPHVIWLDATGRPAIYEKIFGRRVEVIDATPRMFGKIYQVVDRANGKTAMTGQDGELTSKAHQLESLIQKIIADYGYTKPSVIGFKKFVEKSELREVVKTAHFYAARGTNEHEDADAVFIVGAPQANIFDVVKLAKMIYFERENGFRVEWVTKDAPYRYVDADGQGRMYPVTGFWNDADLQAVLETLREDEIIQAAHRGRPVNHPVDIWLLTNIPIESLPPDELLTMREIMGAPDGVNVFKWSIVQAVMGEKETITIQDLVNAGLNYETASGYLEIIAGLPGWDWSVTRTGKRGKPAKAVGRT